MNASVQVEQLDNSSLQVAERIRWVQVAGYSQEAALIGAVHFPPALRVTAEVQSSPDQFFGASTRGELIGVIAIESGRNASIGISSLVVLPEWHRQGVGRTLLKYIMELYGAEEIQVQTAARNLPALGLYREAGFVEVFRWLVDNESLELVALRRSSSAQQQSA